MARDVFLSYSKKDKVAAETVSRALEASGVRVWMAPRDFFPGLDWAESIRAAMDQARFFVLVFSSRANASEHTLRELDYAVSHGKPVIPFRIEDVKPSGRMASLLAVSQWVDAFSPPLEPHADRLAALLRRMLWPSAPVSASGPSASGGGSSDGGSASTGFSWPRRASAPVQAPARRPAPVAIEQLMRLHAVGDARLADDAAHRRRFEEEVSARRFEEEAREEARTRRAEERAYRRPVDDAARAEAPRSGSPPRAASGGHGGPPPALLLVGALLATAGIAYAFHKEIGALVGWFAKSLHLSGLHLSATPPVAAQAPRTSEVDVSAFAPMRAGRGAQFLVQLFLHDPDAERQTIHRMAKAADPRAVRRGVATLDIDVALGERLDFILDGEGVIVAEAHQSLSWRGRPRSCSFLVETPQNFRAKAAQLRVRVLKGAAPVGQIRFSVAIDDGAAQSAIEPAGEAAPRYRRAFLSYASPDRAEVLKRAQALRAAGVDFFNDLLSLEPGERWEQRPYGEIDRCDVFLLFWSRAARESQWVRKEIEHARDAARVTGRSAEILPIILEGPPPPPPPDALADLHFNDPLCYVIAAVEKLNALRPPQAE